MLLSLKIDEGFITNQNWQDLKKDWINVFLLVFWMKQISQHQGRIGLPTKEDMRLKKSF